MADTSTNTTANPFTGNPPLPPSMATTSTGDSNVPLPSGSPSSSPAGAVPNNAASGGFSLASILSQVAGTNTASQSAISGIQASYSDLQSVGKSMVDALTQKGADDSLVSKTAGLGQLRAQENARNVASALGTNMDDTGQVLTSLGQTMLDSYTQSQAAGQTLHDLNSISFLDDPLSWIGAQFSKGKATEDYNFQATRYNSAEQTMSGLLTLTSADAKVQNDIAQTKTAASVQAASDSVAQDAIINQQKVKQQNLLYNVEGITRVQQMNEQQLNNSVQALSAVMSSEQLGLSQQRLAMERTQNAQNATLLAQRIQEGQMNLDEQNQTASYINAGRAVQGLPAIPPGKSIAMLKMGGTVGQQMKDAYTIGASTDSLGKPIISDNSGDAARILVSSKAPLTPVQAPLKSLLTDTYVGVASGSLAKNIDLKNPQAVMASADAFIQTRSKNMQAVINPGDATNIYAPPDIKSIASLPAVANTPLVTKVLAPAITANSLTKFDPEVISGMALAAVQNGTISFNDAVQGIVTLSSGAIQTNNTTKDYTKFGIAPQTTLNMKVLNPSTGTNTSVRFDQAAAVGNYLSRQIISTNQQATGIGGLFTN